MKVVKSKSALLFSTIAMLLIANVALATDLTNFQTIYGTDFNSAGYGGMRDIGTGTISVSGITGPVDTSYLYWHGPSDSTNLSANETVTFNGTSVTGTSLGISSDNCWGYACSLAYRADVTSLVSGDGNYTLADFTKDGNRVNVNGASLVSFYNDVDTSNDRDVVLFNGNDSNIDNPYDAPGWNITLNGINYTSGSAFLQMHVSDGQTFGDDAVLINGMPFLLAGAIFQGDSTPAGPGGPSNGSLWDILSFEITSYLSPGLNNLTFTSGVNSDCLSGILFMVDLPAGAAPPPEVIPEPSTFLLLGGGLAGLAFVVRRRKKE